MPIFIPLAQSMGVDSSLVVAAIMSGVAFGSKFCFYSDAVFMTSAGTGVSNMTQIKAVAPYVLSSAAIAAICFVVVGIVTV
jgi:Na+/H+ antiporter NhaC